MAYNLSAFAGAGAQFFDDNGDPLTGGLLYVYTAGTTTPATTWTSNSGASANTNPIVLDAAGRTPAQIWVNGGVTYKFILKKSTGTLVGTYDNIPGIDDPAVFNNLITVTGTNTLIGTSVPPYTAYVAGMTLSFLPVVTNTGAVTIAVDGLGAKNIYIGNASPLTGGELVAGRIAQIEYDGTRFQLPVSSIADGSVTTNKIANANVTFAKIQNVSTARLIGRTTAGSGSVEELTASAARTLLDYVVDVQTFNSTTTWTKPTGNQNMARIQVWGGGGGGGRSASASTAGGAGGGGYNELTVPLSYLASSLTVTVGAAGTGATVAGAGAAGGTSSVPLATSVNGRSVVEAYGGAGGGDGSGGGGGGQISAGSGSTVGSPSIRVIGTTTSPLGTGAIGAFGSGNIFGGGGGALSQPGGGSFYGGGGGSRTSIAAGESVWGGAGGSDAAGTAPGGGGGASATANVNGSAGGAGRVIITCY